MSEFMAYGTVDAAVFPEIPGTYGDIRSEKRYDRRKDSQKLLDILALDESAVMYHYGTADIQ